MDILIFGLPIATFLFLLIAINKSNENDGGEEWQ